MTVTFGFWPFTSSHSSSKHNSESPYYYWNGDWYSSNSPYGYYRGVAYTSPAVPAAPAAPALPPTPYFPPYGYGWGGGFYGGYGGFGYPFFPGPTLPTPDPHEPTTEEPHTTEPTTEEPHTTEPGVEPGFTIPFPTVTYPENSPGPVLPPYGLNPFSSLGGYGYPGLDASGTQPGTSAEHSGTEAAGSAGEAAPAFGHSVQARLLKNVSQTQNASAQQNPFSELSSSGESV